MPPKVYYSRMSDSGKIIALASQLLLNFYRLHVRNDRHPLGTREAAGGGDQCARLVNEALEKIQDKQYKEEGYTIV